MNLIINTDYAESVRAWLKQYELLVTDLHASNGNNRKSWDSPIEEERLTGVELVANRIDLVAALGGDVIVMHTGMPTEGQESTNWRQLRRSLDSIEDETSFLEQAVAAGNRLALMVDMKTRGQ